MSEPDRSRAPDSLDPSDEVNLSDLGTALWRGRWLIALVTLAAILVGGAVAWLQPRVYESTALVRIVPEEKGFDLGASSSNSMKLLLGLENTGDLVTAVGILESRRIAESVMDSLALHVVLREPARPRDQVVRVHEAPRVNRKTTLDLRHVGSGNYSLSIRGAAAAAPDRVEVGAPFRVGDLVVEINPDLRVNPPSRIRLELQPYQKAVRRLQDRLSVTQPGAGSQLVRLRYRHPDSMLVAAVPNLAAARFIEYKNRTSSADSRSILGFLQEQSVGYQQDLRLAENRLQGFLESARIIEPKTQAEEQAKRLAELQAEREALETEREALAALLRQIEATSSASDGPSPYRQLIAFPSFLTNSMVQNILHSIITLENERSELLVRRMETNTDVVGRTRRIGELETELHNIARNYLADQNLRIAALTSTLGRFAASLAELPSQEVELRRLARQTELLEEVYTMIELKRKEEEIRAAAQLANVQVVDTALIPDEAEYPKPWLYMAFSGLLGLFIGSGSAVLRSRANPTVNTRQDVYAATAGLPVLAAIDLSGRARRDTQWSHRPPSNGAPGNAKLDMGKPGTSHRGPVRINAIWPSRRADSGADQVRIAPLISLVDPADRLADSYRSLRTNMGIVDTPGTGRVLMLTGADAGDDSAVTAANLAIAYAQQGTRVVLVDADLRTGSLHSLFDVSKEPGLTDVLMAPATLAAVVQELTVGSGGAPLHLLTSGEVKQNPADVVGSGAMRTLIAELRERYEEVIITAPPVNSAPDAALLARFADRTLLVVTTGATTRPSLETAARQLQQLRAPVEGIVMNGIA